MSQQHPKTAHVEVEPQDRVLRDDVLELLKVLEESPVNFRVVPVWQLCANVCKHTYETIAVLRSRYVPTDPKAVFHEVEGPIHDLKSPEGHQMTWPLVRRILTAAHFALDVELAKVSEETESPEVSRNGPPQSPGHAPAASAPSLSAQDGVSEDGEIPSGATFRVIPSPYGLHEQGTPVTAFAVRLYEHQVHAAIANLLHGDPEHFRPADILLVFLAQQELERIRKADIAKQTGLYTHSDVGPGGGRNGEP